MFVVLDRIVRDEMIVVTNLPNAREVNILRYLYSPDSKETLQSLLQTFSKLSKRKKEALGKHISNNFKIQLNDNYKRQECLYSRENIANNRSS
jgi:hypothetical protein